MLLSATALRTACNRSSRNLLRQSARAFVVGNSRPQAPAVQPFASSISKLAANHTSSTIFNSPTSSSHPSNAMSVFSTATLHDKVVLVTGASGGIGAATAILFARAGANVIISARREDKLKEVAEACRQANKEGGSEKGGKVFEWVLDVSDRKAADALFDKLPTEFKKIDVLVNNAGLVYGRDHVGDVNEEESDIMFNTNVIGMIHLTQILVKHFKQNNAGHIIQLGSVAGREGYAGGSIYCATKHALHGFTVAMMKELVNTPIRVTEIQPGMVETSFSVTRFRGDADAAKEVYKGLQPLTAEDVAEDIVWAASRKAHINVAEVFLLPVNQASPTVVHRAE